MRRIRRVSVTIPAVTGPYTGLGCTLTLTKSTLRTSPLITDGYTRQDSSDTRFVDYFSATQSIVATSGQHDSGLFEVNPHDDRLLPFEGAGAESTWKLELPSDFRQFDYATISDVALHIRYTAREGGAPLRTAATENLAELVADTGSTGLGLLLSLRHDFPGDWAAFLAGAGDFTATLRREHFPYLTQGETITIAGFDIHRVAGSGKPKHHVVGDQNAWATATTALNDDGHCTFAASVDSAGPTQVLTRSATADVWLIVKYALE